MTEVVPVHQPDRLLDLIFILFAVCTFGMIGFFGYISTNPRQPLGPPFLKASAGCLVIIGMMVAYGALLNPVVTVELNEDQVTLTYTRGEDVTLIKGDVESVRLIHPLPPKTGLSTIRLDAKAGKPYYNGIGRRGARDLSERIALRLGLHETGNQTNRWGR